jgi:AAHS family benzoate transporter-like MFS transporter
MAIALPAVVGMIAVLLIDHSRSASAHHEDVSADLPEPAAGVSVAHGA